MTDYSLKGAPLSKADPLRTPPTFAQANNSSTQHQRLLRERGYR